MRKLVLASNNQGKVAELQRLLTQFANDISVIGLKNYPDLSEIEETGDSFEANSLIKARSVAIHTGLPALADDSGLCIDALNGDPGIFSARWAGKHGDDAANIAKVLNQLQGVTNRSAQFKCVVTLVIPDAGRERVEVATGEVAGVITTAPRGGSGFGYDPIFQPLNSALTFGELTHEEKDKISHRGRALGKIAPTISKLL